jgi:hypothetical protein
MRYVAVCIIIVLVASCTDHMKVPKGIIGKDKMEKILWDMLQADRYVNTFIMQGKDTTGEKKKQAAIFYDRVFKIYGISRDEFIKSYKFYLGRPDITKVMFDSISARAERRRAEAHMFKSKNPFLQKRDSLLRADSIRRQDSLDRIDNEHSTENMSDSEIRKKLYKK